MRKSKRDLTSTRRKINSVSCTANLDTDMCQFLIVGIGFLPNDRSGWISFHSFFIGQINFLLQPSVRNIMKCKTRKTRSSTKRSSGTQWKQELALKNAKKTVAFPGKKSYFKIVTLRDDNVKLNPHRLCGGKHQVWNHTQGDKTNNQESHLLASFTSVPLLSERKEIHYFKTLHEPFWKQCQNVSDNPRLQRRNFVGDEEHANSAR